MVLMVAVAAVAIAAVMLWSLVRTIVRSPDALARYMRTRRSVRGYRAVSQGLVAVGSGDVARRPQIHRRGQAASHRTSRLRCCCPRRPRSSSGDRDGAARTFQQMAGRDDTKLLGLHGLFIEARRRDDPAAALLYAEEAAKHASMPLGGQAVLEFRCVAGDWSGALERLERNHKGGLIDKADYRRQRAVLLTAQALARWRTSDRDRAKALVLEAVKLAPDLVPAAALAGRMLGEAGEPRKAARIIEAAWV